MQQHKEQELQNSKKSKFKKYFRRSLIVGACMYTFLYASMLDLMRYEYKNRTATEIKMSETWDTLLVEDYIATIDGKRKCITLFGETHVYNLKEHLRSIDLVENYDKIYFETGSRKHMQENIKKENELLAYTIDYFAPVYRFYLSFWRGRYYPNISDYLEQKNKPPIPIEDLNFFYENASASYLFQHFYDNFSMLLFGPFNYKYFKYEFSVKEYMDYEPSQEIRDNLLDGRDIIMAQNIVKAIKESETPILVGFGLLHYKGILKNLRYKENVLLKKVDSLEECKKRVETCEDSHYFSY